jgi:hypothetical protein
MANRQRTASIVLLGSITMLWVASLAAPANAEVFQGSCTGSATFSDATVVTEKTPVSEVVLVPEKDTVQWKGDTHLDPPGDEVPFVGNVSVALPRFNWIVADWSGDTKEVKDEGSYSYEVPGFVPRGVQFEVTGEHTQQGQTCVVTVTMKVAGDRGPEAIIAATGTAVFALATLGAGVKKRVA